MDSEENKPLTDRESHELWEKLTSRIKAHEKEKRKRKVVRFASISVAAAVLLVSSIISYKVFIMPDIYHAENTNLKITLQDGSVVTLDKGANLRVDKSFPSATRDVFLEGNAVFNVSKSKIHPFIVHAKGYETKVLGTIFKVTQRGKTFNVELYEGKVQVTKTDKPKDVFVLRPKETFSNLGMAKVATVVATKNQDKSQDTKTATLSFDNTNLADVVQVIEQTFGLKIKYPKELGYQKISITKEKTTPTEVLKLISLQLDLDDKTFELEK